MKSRLRHRDVAIAYLYLQSPEEEGGPAVQEFRPDELSWGLFRAVLEEGEYPARRLSRFEQILHARNMNVCSGSRRQFCRGLSEGARLAQAASRKD